MNISAEKNRYLREAEVVLAREGFLTDRTHAGSLRVLFDGAPLCEVPESGGVTYRMADVSTPERIAAKDKVYSIVRAVAEYMYQMERAPILKVDGLEDSYKLLTASTTVNGKDVTMTDGNAIVPLTVVNNPGFDLPKTGGYGTWMFTIGGVALLGAAAFIVIRSRKHKNEQ